MLVPQHNCYALERLLTLFHNRIKKEGKEEGQLTGRTLPYRSPFTEENSGVMIRRRMSPIAAGWCSYITKNGRLFILPILPFSSFVFDPALTDFRHTPISVSRLPSSLVLRSVCFPGGLTTSSSSSCSGVIQMRSPSFRR